MRTRPSLYLALVAVVSSATVFAAAVYPENASVEARLAIESLEALGSATCPSNCEFDCISEHEHNNHEVSGGNDSGEIHSCAWSNGQCSDHTCGLTQLDDVEILEDILPRLKVPELRGLYASQSNLILNTQRRAIQVLACGKVVLSLPMSSVQVATLMED